MKKNQIKKEETISIIIIMSILIIWVGLFIVAII